MQRMTPLISTSLHCKDFSIPSLLEAVRSMVTVNLRPRGMLKFRSPSRSLATASDRTASLKSFWIGFFPGLFPSLFLPQHGHVLVSISFLPSSNLVEATGLFTCINEEKSQIIETDQDSQLHKGEVRRFAIPRSSPHLMSHVSIEKCLSTCILSSKTWHFFKWGCEKNVTPLSVHGSLVSVMCTVVLSSTLQHDVHVNPHKRTQWVVNYSTIHEVSFLTNFSPFRPKENWRIRVTLGYLRNHLANVPLQPLKPPTHRSQRDRQALVGWQMDDVQEIS